MEPSRIPRTQQFPAVHPKLAAAVDTAIAYLKTWARGQGETWEALTHADALILKTLLQGSRPDGDQVEARRVELVDLQALFQEALDARRWDKFLRWYAVEVAEGMASLHRERNQPVLFPARVGGNGGRGPKGKAVYFLSFEEPSLLREARDANRTEFLFKRSRPADTVREPSHAPENATVHSESTPPTSSSRSSSQLDGESPDAATGTQRPRLSAAPPKEHYGEPAPMALALSMSRAQSSGSPVVWMLVVLLAVILSTARSADSPVADEILRMLAAVREAITGGTVVRL